MAWRSVQPIAAYKPRGVAAKSIHALADELLARIEAAGAGGKGEGDGQKEAA